MALTQLWNSPFGLAGLVFGIVGALLLLSGLGALIRLRPFRFVWRTIFGLLLLAVGVLAATIAIGTHGYTALTREDIAATLLVQPTGPQRFSATVRYPDLREVKVELAGDEVYVDAQILKWNPIASVLGLHTAYELDRIAGRYRSIDHERSAPRTVFPLSRDKPLDLFDLRQRYAFLAPLLDAEYGSASYVVVSRPAEIELRVSTTGLLMREVKQAQ
jgi:energy-converting hydrogenase Eha subunit A